MRFSRKPKKSSARARWINTRLEYSPDGRLLHRDGFWHKGPVLDAGGAQSRGGSWRFSDDGTETGAVLLGTVNTNPAKGDLVNGTVYHLRFGIEEAAGGGLMNFSPQLQYNKNSGGWVDVNGSSSNIQSAAGGLVDGEDTVARSGVSQGEYTEDTTNEGADEVDGIAGGNTADLSNTGAEFVWSFQIIDADVADDDTIEIRPIMAQGGADLDFYDQSWPTVTVEKDAGVTVGITNVLATAAVGAVQALFSLLLSTVLATAAVGSVSPGVSVALTGVGGTSAVGNVGITKSGTVALTGVGATAAEGTVGNGTSVALTSADGSETLDLQVGADLDDVVIRTTTAGYFNNLDYQRAGDLGGASTGFIGIMRFTGVAIPPGSTIISARLEQIARSTQSGTVCRTVIDCEAADDAARIVSHADYTGRSWTSGTSWNVPALTADENFTSLDFSGALQAVIDRVGFDSGNAVNVRWGDSGELSDDSAYREGKSHNLAPAEAAILHVEFASTTTAAVGSVGPVNTQDITGEEATAAVGNVSAGGDVEQALTGVEATAAVGNVGFTESGSVGLTGVAGTSAVGDIAPDTSLALTGVEGASAVGSVGSETSPALSGETGTSAVGSVDNETEVPLTGVEATAAVGSVSVEGEAGAVLTGVGATAAVGNVGITKSGTVALTGVEATAAVGGVGVINDQELSGVDATAAVGSVSNSVSVALTGVGGTSAVGSVGVQASIPLSGVEATAAVGNVSFTKSGSVALTGVVAVAAVGSVKAADVGQPMTATPSISPVLTATPGIQPVMTATPKLEP